MRKMKRIMIRRLLETEPSRAVPSEQMIPEFLCEDPGKGIHSKRNSRCKGPEAGESLTRCRKRNQACVAK